MNSAQLRMGHSVCILLACNGSLLLMATGELSVIERLESEAEAAAGRRERVVDAMEAQLAIAWMKLTDYVDVEGGGHCITKSAAVEPEIHSRNQRGAQCDADRVPAHPQSVDSPRCPVFSAICIRSASTCVPEGRHNLIRSTGIKRTTKT